MEDSCTLRWAVNMAAWQPSQAELSMLVGLLPQEDAAACAAYRLERDRLRAVVGRLLSRQAVSRVLGVPWATAHIQRTRGRKPFCADAGAGRAAAPNFNFNVSHEGDWTVLASEPLCLVGVDVAAPQQLRRQQGAPLHAALERLRHELTPAEWALVSTFTAEEQSMEAMFQRIWSCKEAYIKARGDGLGFAPLSRAEVQFGANPWSSTANLTVDGLPQPRWRLYLQELPGRHWVTVARGPPEAAVDAFGVFKASFGQPFLSDADMQRLLDSRNPAFEVLQIEDLLPEEALDAYCAVAT